MNLASVKHAQLRLDKTKAALVRLNSASSLEETKDAWTDFLLSASGIYSKLEQGAKSSPASAGWFGRVKHERKKDELLRYIHHARNADEHGISEVTELTFAQSFGNRRVGTLEIHIEAIRKPDAKEYGRMSDDPLVQKLQSKGWSAYVSLSDVKDDRYDDTYPVPTEHRGVPILLNSPLSVAEAAIPYLEELVLAATNFVPSEPQ